jgi:Ku70/Ku80 C-terminal arm
MDLSNSTSFWPKHTFNPTYRRLYQCIIARSLDDGDLPDPDFKITLQLESIPFEGANKYVDEIKRCFEVEVVERKVKRRVGGEVSKDAQKNLEEEIEKDLDFLMD